MELDGDTPPFWSQHPHRHRRQSSPILNPVALILAIPIIFLLILFFIVPPIISHVNEVVRPSSVKKSWDSINIVLVLFAVFCGVFVRRNDENLSSDDHVGAAQNQNQDTIVSNIVNKPIRQSVSSWLDFPDRKEYNRMSSGVRLKRSSSSYPDLRQESLWESGGENRVKFYDDFEVNDVYRSPPREKLHRRRRRINKAEKEKEEKEKEVETRIQENSADKFEGESAPVPPTPPEPKSPDPPPAPPPPLSTATLKRRRSFHNVPRKEDKESRNEGNEAELSEIQPASSPPPPPSEPESHSSPESIRKKLQRNMSNTKEIATAIASLYKGQRRKRKKNVKIIDIDETAQQDSSPPSSPPPRQLTPIPPPPPPPPPSKVLQNLFKKSSKSKRIHSIATNAPPPPPPPPPSSIFNTLFKNGTKSQRFKNVGNSIPPPPPPPPSSILNSLFKNGTKSQHFKNVNNGIPPPPPPPPSSILNSLFKNGSKSLRFKNASTTPPPPPPPPPSENRVRLNFSSGKPPRPNTRYDESVIVAPPSPLIPMPPPPPPFTMREAKFVAQGDFVRIQSASSSRCSSPEREDFDTMSIKSDGGDPIGPSVSCPSPDVNAKADSFIARLRDEWRLEKINSVRHLGPT